MKGLVTSLITSLLASAALATGAAADSGVSGASQPSAIERLVRQEDARGTGAASIGTGPSQPTAIERLVRQEDARRNDPALGITRATQVIPVPTPPRIEVVARDGFDWLDAVIGAAATMAVVAALGGAMLVVRSLTPGHGTPLLAVASIATVVGDGVGAAGGTQPWLSALNARSEALNEQHGLGVERGVLGAPAPGWLEALNARSDALNRQYGLGEYAKG